MVVILDKPFNVAIKISRAFFFDEVNERGIGLCLLMDISIPEF